MIVIDIGNTSTVVGIYVAEKLFKTYRINTTKNKSKFKIIFNNLFKSKKKTISRYGSGCCILSSVVPSLNLIVKNYFKKNKFRFYIIDPKNIPMNVKINYKIDQIGSDRIANYIAAYSKKITNSIIVDFGTATTFDIIKNNEYFGGLIFPGITLSMNSLVNNAELLKKSKITKVKKIIARDTASSIKSGFYFGYLHSINGILNQIIKENKFKPKIILTGGLGYIFKDNVNFNPIYNEYLTLEGIREIGRHIQDEQWSRIK